MKADLFKHRKCIILTFWVKRVSLSSLLKQGGWILVLQLSTRPPPGPWRPQGAPRCCGMPQAPRSWGGMRACFHVPGAAPTASRTSGCPLSPFSSLGPALAVQSLKRKCSVLGFLPVCFMTSRPGRASGAGSPARSAPAPGSAPPSRSVLFSL